LADQDAKLIANGYEPIAVIGKAGAARTAVGEHLRILLGKSGLAPDRLLRWQRPPSYLGQFVQELGALLLPDRIHRRPFGGRKASD